MKKVNFEKKVSKMTMKYRSKAIKESEKSVERIRARLNFFLQGYKLKCSEITVKRDAEMYGKTDLVRYPYFLECFDNMLDNIDSALDMLGIVKELDK